MRECLLERIGECRREFFLTWMAKVIGDIVLGDRGALMEKDGSNPWEYRNMGRKGTTITLFVDNLLDFSTWSWLHALLWRWGTVTDTFMPRKKDTAGRTFDFVRMVSESPAEKVIVALNGTVVLGRKLQVNSGFFFSEERGPEPCLPLDQSFQAKSC